MIMKSFGYVVSIDDNRIIIDCYESNEFLKPRIVGLIKSNVTGDEKVENFIKDVMFCKTIGCFSLRVRGLKILCDTAGLLFTDTSLITSADT